MHPDPVIRLHVRVASAAVVPTQDHFLILTTQVPAATASPIKYRPIPSNHRNDTAGLSRRLKFQSWRVRSRDTRIYSLKKRMNWYGDSGSRQND